MPTEMHNVPRISREQDSFLKDPIDLARQQFQRGEDPSVALKLAEINLHEYLLRQDLPQQFSADNHPLWGELV